MATTTAAGTTNMSMSGTIKATHIDRPGIISKKRR